MGHGVSASLMTMLIKSEFDKIKYNIESPSELLQRLNEFFAENYKTLQTFFTGIIADIDTKKNIMHFASAGHHEQFFISGKKLVKLHRTGRAVGISRDSSYSSISLPYEPGDRLFLFTDGVFEEFNLNKEEFGIDRLEKFVEERIDLDGKILAEDLISAVDSYIAEDQMNDDLTFITIDFI